MIPQDLYMDVHESKIVIPDLENLDDEKYPPKVTVSLIYNGYCDDYRNVLEVMFCGYILLIESIKYSLVSQKSGL